MRRFQHLNTKRLINGLHKAAAQMREHPDYYDWYDSKRCNCGILAQAVGISEMDLHKAYIGCWSRSASRYCEISGLPISTIFKVLREVGVETPEDFEFLEHKCGYLPEDVAARFEKLAEDLAKQLPA